jgi:hypothetical protein
LAAGALLVFLPHGSAPRTGAAQVVPLLGKNTGGLELAGHW